MRAPARTRYHVTVLGLSRRPAVAVVIAPETGKRLSFIRENPLIAVLARDVAPDEVEIAGKFHVETWGRFVAAINGENDLPQFPPVLINEG